ncbi:hypothetical protein F3Y22_tig00110187pilonHSYRG00143 [Hibiscus syriacus]|uniref:Uncharacterized protein n=1 Tax=Hibiscus syriacus TaxID=106335 RepID=A0A6A3BFI1_HIBSY|nr:hypothetical protein F3Y22_tig00110187pilonHSYRG00143 [Hibiscus syriacus]
MAKKKSWFSLVKMFFLIETIAKTEKKENWRKWMLGSSRTKRLTAPIKDEHIVAEEVVSAAQVAAEIVPLADTHQSEYICKESSVGAEGDSEASSNHLRNGCEMTSNDYSKMLTVDTEHSVSGLCKEIPSGGRHLAI